MRPSTRTGAAIGAIATIVITILFRTTSLDIDLQGLAYSGREPRWPYAEHPFWDALHDFGTIPGALLALGAIAIATASFLDERLVRWRYPALYVVAVTAVGPGLVTNILGKVIAGRPRPEEIVEFGGTLSFLEPFELGTPGKGFSFLCGHCSMGFLFFAFFFLLRGTWRWAALAGGATYGTLLGAARMVQGAHFASDALLDGTIMFTVAALLAPIATMTPRPAERPMPRYRAILIGSLVAIAFIVLALFSTPMHRQRTHAWVETRYRRAATHETLLLWPAQSRRLVIRVERGDVAVRAVPSRDRASIQSLIRGFGFPTAGSETRTRVEGDAVVYEHRLTGAYWEVHVRFDVTVDEDIEVQVVRTKDSSAPRAY